LIKADFTFHVYARTQGIAGVIISDNEYPSLAAHQILSKILDEFLSQNPSAATSRNPVPFPQLRTYITTYQNPQEVDSIMKIQKELDETKIVLHKTIESVSWLWKLAGRELTPARFWNEERRSTTWSPRARG
jgi:synaptobrevin family protein YKT6